MFWNGRRLGAQRHTLRQHPGDYEQEAYRLDGRYPARCRVSLEARSRLRRLRVARDSLHPGAKRWDGPC